MNRAVQNDHSMINGCIYKLYGSMAAKVHFEMHFEWKMSGSTIANGNS
jgi:hypothetical protein